MISPPLMTIKDFLERDERGEFGQGVWELIDGRPELKMEGGTWAHERIRANVTSTLLRELKGKPWSGWWTSWYSSSRAKRQCRTESLSSRLWGGLRKT